VEIEESEHFKISFKENEYLYRLDIEDCNNDHFGKIKIVAKNENGESEKEVRRYIVISQRLYLQRPSRNCDLCTGGSF